MVSKYEIRQYRGSILDQAVILLILLTGFLMLVTPQVQDSELPSSHSIYRVGYVEGSVVGRLKPYSIRLVPYQSQYDMIQASSLHEIDAFATQGRQGIVVFGSGSAKSDAALGRMNALLAGFNGEMVAEYIQKDRNLSGVLLPLRLMVLEEKINYDSVMNGSLDAKRRLLLGKQRKGEAESPDAAAPASAAGSEAASASGAPEQAPEGALSGNSALSLPSEMGIEFPFKTLYRNMTLLSPLVLLSFLLSLSLSRERIDRNIENLFDSPLTNTEILIGKSLPYFALMALLSLSYGLFITFSLEALKIAAVFAVLSCAMLSFSLFSVLVSRSYRELTFIGSFSMFAFFFFIILPNVFSGVNVLALISPLDTVTSIENGATMTYTDLGLSLLPYCFLSMFFLSFTGVCFNAEVLFSSKGFAELLAVFYSGLSRMLRNKAAYAAVSVALLVPFIFIIESILAYLVLPLGAFAPIMSLMLLASVEEIVKIIPYAYKRMNPVLYGIVAGTSFFITEKLFNLYLIYNVYNYLGGPYVFFIQKMMPALIIHILSTMLFATILRYGRRRAWFGVGLLLSMVIHVIYNYTILAGSI
ncbi:MAG: hypothetical protein V1875_06910 [Candidatus Altiarchaeota archaeon]